MAAGWSPPPHPQCPVGGRCCSSSCRAGPALAVRSHVAHGDKRGRTIGYPTANLSLDPSCRLKHGIYAVRAFVDGQTRDGVASFGRRPTFDNGAPKLEVFLFDFSGDLYGKGMDVELHAFIRPELKFDTVEALVAQMAVDCTEAKRLLAADASLSRPPAV